MRMFVQTMSTGFLVLANKRAPQPPSRQVMAALFPHDNFIIPFEYISYVAKPHIATWIFSSPGPGPSVINIKPLQKITTRRQMATFLNRNLIICSSRSSRGPALLPGTAVRGRSRGCSITAVGGLGYPVPALLGTGFSKASKDPRAGALAMGGAACAAGSVLEHDDVHQVPNSPWPLLHSQP